MCNSIKMMCKDNYSNQLTAQGEKRPDTATICIYVLPNLILHITRSDRHNLHLRTILY